MAIQQRVFARAERLIDRVVSPQTRGQFYENINTFATAQPFLAAFLAIQIILSFTPVALFLSFSAGVILVSFVSALLFSLFWLGVALLVLVPTLFITVSLGLGVWVWLVTNFVIARWIYNVLPINTRGHAEVAFPNGKKIVVDKTGGGYGDVKGEVKEDS